MELGDKPILSIMNTFRAFEQISALGKAAADIPLSVRVKSDECPNLTNKNKDI